MKVAAAESAVLDSAAQKEKEAHKSLQAVQAQAELLAKEKRATREAMQKALALQAEAREKIAQSEALLAQYGLADVPPQPTPPQRARRPLQQASSGYERGQQSGEPPNPHAPAWGGCSTSNRLPPVATGAAPWAAKRSEQRGGAGGHPCKLVRAQRLAANILKSIIKA